MDYISDIHTHIVYGIDDGSDDLEMSLKLLEMEYDQGVREIFLTNHSYGMAEKYENYHARFDELTRLASDRFEGLRLFANAVIKNMPIRSCLEM